eukprot:2721421-Pyramimonas_sp.AAC.1
MKPRLTPPGVCHVPVCSKVMYVTHLGQDLPGEGAGGERFERVAGGVQRLAGHHVHHAEELLGEGRHGVHPLEQLLQAGPRHEDELHERPPLPARAGTVQYSEYIKYSTSFEQGRRPRPPVNKVHYSTVQYSTVQYSSVRT